MAVRGPVVSTKTYAFFEPEDDIDHTDLEHWSHMYCHTFHVFDWLQPYCDGYGDPKNNWC